MEQIKQQAKQSILIVEDEPVIADLIELALKSLNVAEINKVISAEQASFLLQNKSYDLLIVDWMLPGQQGVDFIKQLANAEFANTQMGSQQTTKKPLVLMLTAKADPESIVQGLEAGADDYLSKPFDNRILTLRVRNLLRRATLVHNSQVESLGFDDKVELNGLCIDYARVEVSLRGESIHLTPSEFKLLGFLLKSQGRVLTRDQLIDLIQGEDVSVTGRTIDTHVFALRKKLLDWSEHIETIRGVGYRVNYST